MPQHWRAREACRATKPMADLSQFKEATAAVKHSPHAVSAWEEAEGLAADLDKPDEIVLLYDNAITAAKDKVRRVKLLREAAQLAKDVANQPDKAIAYYQRLLPLVPDDVQVGTGLERLLERHERWAELIALWESRLESQS